MSSNRTSSTVAFGLGVTVAVLAVLGCLFWVSRAFWHGLYMIGYQYPLLTWVPLLLALVISGVFYGVAFAGGRGSRNDGYYGEVLVAWPAVIGCGAAAVQFLVAAVMLWGWQGDALAKDISFERISSLPQETQPRILPKSAASSFTDSRDFHHAHFVADPVTGQISFSAEKAPKGAWNKGPSKQIALMPLDRVDGKMAVKQAGFKVAVSQVGSMNWRALKKQYNVTIEDPVIAPTAGGGYVAISPYIGYKGFLVKRPYWKGVFVLHQDDRLEDLTPEQAMARPELAATGRIYPEKLTRLQVQAYTKNHGSRLTDPEYYGNPQPYLTKINGDRIAWVTVTNRADDEDAVAQVTLTDTTTGKTQVWEAPKDRRVLSNDAAFKLVERIKGIKWRDCCDSEGYSYTLRYAAEPRPVFSKGRFYYLVSIMATHELEGRKGPVDKTVLVDASERRIVKVYDHSANGEADDQLRVFFGAPPVPIG